MKILIALAMLGGAAFAIAYGLAGIFSRKTKFASVGVLSFLRDNFDALANDDGVITYGSLKKAVNKFPGNAEHIRFAQEHIGEFGHVIGYDNEAKAAAMLSASMASPMGVATLAAADFAIHAISREDLGGTITITVSHWGTVKVTRG
jgi:hypothetical protein